MDNAAPPTAGDAPLPAGFIARGHGGVPNGGRRAFRPSAPAAFPGAAGTRPAKTTRGPAPTG
ncbi:hypothetical protein GCM10018953_57160 [Streptosporangium nondiastaticum]